MRQGFDNNPSLRAEASEIAKARHTAARKLREEIKELPAGKDRERLAEILEFPDENIGAFKLPKLLSLPYGVSERIAVRLLADAYINPDKRLREITANQRRVLAAAILNDYRVEKLVA